MHPLDQMNRANQIAMMGQSLSNQMGLPQPMPQQLDPYGNAYGLGGGLGGLGAAGAAAYCRTPLGIIETMEMEVNDWLKDWDK